MKKICAVGNVLQPTSTKQLERTFLPIEQP